MLLLKIWLGFTSARIGGETCAHQLSGTDVLGWCVDELFRCVRVILAGGEIRASCVTPVFHVVL